MMFSELAESVVEQRLSELPAPPMTQPLAADPAPMVPPALNANGSADSGLATPHQFLIRGVTSCGKPFRPSDWAERLCGVLSSYRPGAQGAGRAAHLGYSPYARPVVIDGVRCVIIDARLRDLEVMAYDFALNFARDNELTVSELGKVAAGGAMVATATTATTPTSTT